MPECAVAALYALVPGLDRNQELGTALGTVV
jgi:hypothetical protein